MFSYLVGLFQRAMNNQKLTPHERAALKAVQGVVIGFAVSIIPDLIRVYVGHGHFNWTADGINSLLTAFALALLKLWLAQSDSHIGDILDAYSQQLEQQGIRSITGTAPSPDGTITIPAVHMVIPSVKAIASTTPIQIGESPDEKNVTVRSTTANAAGKTLSQFVVKPIVPTEQRPDIPTQPLPITPVQQKSSVTPVLPLVPNTPETQGE